MADEVTNTQADIDDDLHSDSHVDLTADMMADMTADLTTDLTADQHNTHTSDTPEHDPFLHSPLFDAIRDQKLDLVRKLIPESNMNSRDMSGRSYLHCALAMRSSPDIYRALLTVSDLSQRDENGNTVIDIGLDDQDLLEPFLVLVEEYINQMMLEGDTVKLEKFVLAGLEVPRPNSDKQVEIRAHSEEMATLIDQLQGFEERISQLHDAVHEGDLDRVKQFLEKKKLAKARDVTGMIPLHKAVVFEHTRTLQYLAENFPVLIDTTDHMGRTALHYASVSTNEQLYECLIENGATEDATDIKGKTPAYYKEHPEKLVLADIQKNILEKTAQVRKTMRSRPSAAERKAAADERRRSGDVGTVGAQVSFRRPVYDPQKDPFLVDKAPPPKTPDTMYVAQNLGEPLAVALAEIVDKRPWDPIEFLAQWLYHYSRQTKYQDKMREENEKLEAEREMALTDEERLAKCEEEIETLRREEESKRKEEEEEQRRTRLLEERRKSQESGLVPPHLATVTEESDNEPDSARMQPKPGLRDINGQTELHRAAMAEGTNLSELLTDHGYDVSLRDAGGNTAYQLATQADIEANQNAINEYVISLFINGNLDPINALIINNYDNFPDLDEKFSAEGFEVNEEAMTAWQERQETQSKIEKLREYINMGDSDTFKLELTNPVHLWSRDSNGHTLLHYAVLHIQPGLVAFMADNHPTLLNEVDNYDRTALHYAAAIDANIYTLLRATGTDEALADIYGKMACNYIGSDKRGEILSVVDGLEERVHQRMASEIFDAVDGIEKRSSLMVNDDVDGDYDVGADDDATAEAAEEAEDDEAD